MDLSPGDHPCVLLPVVRPENAKALDQKRTGLVDRAVSEAVDDVSVALQQYFFNYGH